jgi:toxin ParE1/3/4
MDTVEHAHYIGRHQPLAAARFMDAVDDATRQLADHPELGSLCEVDHPRLRDVRVWTIPSFRNHLIFYRVTSTEIIILRVLHGAQNWKEILNP